MEGFMLVLVNVVLHCTCPEIKRLPHVNVFAHNFRFNDLFKTYMSFLLLIQKEKRMIRSNIIHQVNVYQRLSKLSN